MEKQRTFLLIALAVVTFIIYQRWVSYVDVNAPAGATPAQQQTADTPQAVVDSDVPETPDVTTPATTPLPSQDIPELAVETESGQLVVVKTDLVTAYINTRGAVLERLELNQQPVSLDRPDEGFPLFKQEQTRRGLDVLVSQSGLLARGFDTPNHHAQYQVFESEYRLQPGQDNLQVPLFWNGPDGIRYTKEFEFTADSYLIDIRYRIENNAETDWVGFLYAQLSRTPPAEGNGMNLARLPSFNGGAIYTPETKYEKIDYDEMADRDLQRPTPSGWIGMLQHYFTSVWIPEPGGNYEFYSDSNNGAGGSQYKMGYKTLDATSVAPGAAATIETSLFAGPKEQRRLKQIEKDRGIQGLALTVDYGWLTFLADPLFWLLSQINKIVGNWGWSIILLTILIKALFYPLSATSYKSMAAMKKLQPRMQTLKERYADDKQKFQMAMMELYKKEKVNPAGGCLPILIQIPVFIALYWVLLESVEMRHAPFMLWWQDLSAPDPFYVLPVLMGGSMFLQQKLNPQPMEPMQQKIMMIMPVMLTVLFLSFPQGLVLYWVVNNILSIAQQWVINRNAGAD